jgi:hypothetical protein
MREMIVYSVQELQVYKKMREKGYLEGDPALAMLRVERFIAK